MSIFISYKTYILPILIFIITGFAIYNLYEENILQDVTSYSIDHSEYLANVYSEIDIEMIDLSENGNFSLTNIINIIYLVNNIKIFVGEIGKVGESIEIVHINGLSHRGVWMIILDRWDSLFLSHFWKVIIYHFIINNSTKEHILFVRRSNSTVTCKNSWTIFGEHTKVGETYVGAAIRGLKEELELEDFNFENIAEMSNSLELIKISYSGDTQRKDIQWTKTYIFTLKHSHIFPDSKESNGYLWGNKCQ